MRTTASNTMCHLSSLQNDWQIFCRHAIITVLLLWLQFTSSTKTSLTGGTGGREGERSKIHDSLLTFHPLLLLLLLLESVVPSRLDVLQAVGLQVQDARLSVQQPQVVLVNVPQDLSLDVGPLDDLLLLLLLLLDVVPLLGLEDVEVRPRVVLDTFRFPAGLDRPVLLLVVNVDVEALRVDDIVPAPVTGDIPDIYQR